MSDYGQNPYGGQSPQNPYGGGQNPYGQQGADHPRATTILVLGILGLVVCQILAPIAWIMGNGVVREIDESQGRIGGRSQANAGRICGIVGTVLIAISLVFVVVIFVVALGASTSP